MENINPTDIAVLAVIAISALLAMMRGAVIEIFALIGWVGAGFAAVYFWPQVAPFLEVYFGNESIVKFASGTVIFVLVLIVWAIVTHFIGNQVRNSSFKVTDKSLGFAFGIVRGALIVSLAYLLASWVWPAPGANEEDTRPGWLSGAKSTSAMEIGASFIRGLLPPDIQQSLEETAGAGKMAEDLIEQGDAVTNGALTDGGLLGELGGDDQDMQTDMGEDDGQGYGEDMNEDMNSGDRSRYDRYDNRGSDDSMMEEEEQGYDRRQRMEMERLIENQ